MLNSVEIRVVVLKTREHGSSGRLGHLSAQTRVAPRTVLHASLGQDVLLLIVGRRGRGSGRFWDGAQARQEMGTARARRLLVDVVAVIIVLILMIIRIVGLWTNAEMFDVTVLATRGIARAGHGEIIVVGGDILNIGRIVVVVVVSHLSKTASVPAHVLHCRGLWDEAARRCVCKRDVC